jgi:hypothetical protein
MTDRQMTEREWRCHASGALGFGRASEEASRHKDPIAPTRRHIEPAVWWLDVNSIATAIVIRERSHECLERVLYREHVPAKRRGSLWRRSSSGMARDAFCSENGVATLAHQQEGSPCFHL